MQLQHSFQKKFAGCLKPSGSKNTSKFKHLTVYIRPSSLKCWWFFSQPCRQCFEKFPRVFRSEYLKFNKTTYWFPESEICFKFFFLWTRRMQLLHLCQSFTARNLVSFAQFPKNQTQVFPRKKFSSKCSPGYVEGIFDNADEKLLMMSENVPLWTESKFSVFLSQIFKSIWILSSGQLDCTCDIPAECFPLEIFFRSQFKKTI